MTFQGFKDLYEPWGQNSTYLACIDGPSLDDEVLWSATSKVDGPGTWSEKEAGSDKFSEGRDGIDRDSIIAPGNASTVTPLLPVLLLVCDDRPPVLHCVEIPDIREPEESVGTELREGVTRWLSKLLSKDSDWPLIWLLRSSRLSPAIKRLSERWGPEYVRLGTGRPWAALECTITLAWFNISWDLLTSRLCPGSGILLNIFESLDWFPAAWVGGVWEGGFTITLALLKETSGRLEVLSWGSGVGTVVNGREAPCIRQLLLLRSDRAIRIGSLSNWFLLLDIRWVDLTSIDDLEGTTACRIIPNRSSLLAFGWRRCGRSANGRACTSGVWNGSGGGHPRKVVESERWKNWCLRPDLVVTSDSPSTLSLSTDMLVTGSSSCSSLSFSSWSQEMTEMPSLKSLHNRVYFISEIVLSNNSFYIIFNKSFMKTPLDYTHKKSFIYMINKNPNSF